MSNDTTVYRCVYQFGGERRSTFSPYGIAVFEDGFWISSVGNITISDSGDCRYWIPPSAIVFIEKVTTETAGIGVSGQKG